MSCFGCAHASHGEMDLPARRARPEKAFSEGGRLEVLKRFPGLKQATCSSMGLKRLWADS